MAKVCNQYLQKGKQVLVQGEVSASAYKAEDGTARASLEVTARNVRFLGQNGGENAPRSPEEFGSPNSQGPGAPPALTDEELAEQDMPF